MPREAAASRPCAAAACELRWEPASLPTGLPRTLALGSLEPHHARCTLPQAPSLPPPRRRSSAPATAAALRVAFPPPFDRGRALGRRAATGAQRRAAHHRRALTPHPGQLSPLSVPQLPRHLAISPSLPPSLSRSLSAGLCPSAPPLPPPTAHRAIPAAVGLTPGLIGALCRRLRAAAGRAARLVARASGAAAALSPLLRRAICSPRRSPPSLAPLSALFPFAPRRGVATAPPSLALTARSSPRDISLPPSLPLSEPLGRPLSLRPAPSSADRAPRHPRRRRPHTRSHRRSLP